MVEVATAIVASAAPVASVLSARAIGALGESTAETETTAQKALGREVASDKIGVLDV
jgi:hypothetical protein